MTWLGRTVRLIPVVILFMLTTSCNSFFVSENSIQSVTVSPTAVLLQVGAIPADTYQLTSTAITVGGTNTSDTATATWTSSNPTIATVGSPEILNSVPGLVTLPVTEITGGDTATIKATDGGQSGTATVLTYSGVAPTTMTLTYSLPTGVTASTIPLGTVFLVQANATLNGVNKVLNNTTFSYVTWTVTSNTAGATVNVNGVVTVPANGTAGGFTVVATAYLGIAAPQQQRLHKHSVRRDPVI